jgi:hypothetical protein
MNIRENELTRVHMTWLSRDNSCLLARQWPIGPKVSSMGKVCVCVYVCVRAGAFYKIIA